MMKPDNIGEAHNIALFNRELDQLLQTGELPGRKMDDDEQALIEIALDLAGADLAGLTKSRDELRERLMAMEIAMSEPVSGKMRWAAGLAALVIVAAASLALVPPLRAWAQEAIAQVVHLLITDAQTQEEQTFEQVQTTVPGEGAVFTVVPPSLEEVRQRVDFPVLVPRNFPESTEEDIYAPAWAAERNMTWTSESVFDYPEGVTVIGIYKRWYGVMIHQLRAGEERIEEFPVSDARVQEVVVRGQPGYWIEGAPTGLLESYGSIWPGDKVEPVWVLEDEDVLIWEENGMVYIIQAAKELGMEDLMRIAEALRE